MFFNPHFVSAVDKTARTRLDRTNELMVNTQKMSYQLNRTLISVLSSLGAATERLGYVIRLDRLGLFLRLGVESCSIRCF
jgi:hypothetical protein